MWGKVDSSDVLVLFWSGFLAGVSTLVLLFLVYVGIATPNLPNVYFEPSTGECWHVESRTRGYDCDRLPERYNPKFQHRRDAE